MEVADEIKSRLDIVDLIGQSVQLKKAGRIYKGLCPFHPERTPSFIVYPDQGTWHCFGACGTGGDAFSFVMKRDNLDFGDALRLLAERTGVELHRQGDGEQNKRALLDINKVAAEYYHYLLLNHPSAQFAREYLERRRITRASVVDFALGFAQNAHSSLRDHLESKGFGSTDIERSGLILANESGGGYHDRFRGRLMFPIRNRRGQTIGFGARALSDEDQPKYLNSPETPLFSKSDTLYGLDAAKEAIRDLNLAVIVEGYTDVIVAHQEGFKNVIAAMGTALTERQLSQLKRLTKRYALALDADVAGAAATERGLELARAALTRKQVPVPIGPGMIGFEERLDAELFIIALPEGHDPDEVILQDRAQWQRLVEQATPLVNFYFGAQTRELDLKTAHGKSEAVRRLLPVIGELNDAILRAHYTQELARLVQVDERSLAHQLKPHAGGAKTRPAETTPAAAPAHHGAKFDEHLIAIALAQPALFSRVGFLSADDFSDGWAREIWTALCRHVATVSAFDEEEFLEGLSEPTRVEGARLYRAGKEFEFTELEAAREIEAAAYRLRLQRDREELTQMQYALADATPEEENLLQQRADTLRQRIAESQKAVNQRTVLRNAPPPTWTHEVLR
jgi:DNA primase